jgi:membrane protease YdiL (CAAX protease family)
MSLPPAVIIAFELVLILSGLAVIWRVAFSAAGRARLGTPSLARWDISFIDFLLYLWSIFLGGVIGQFITLMAIRLAPAISGDAQEIIATVGFQFGMLGGCVAGFSLLPGLRAAAAAAPPRTAAMNPLLGGGATFLAAIPVVVVVGLVWQQSLQALGLPVEKQELMDLFENAESPALLAVMIFLAIVVAPVTEELVFRAGIFRFARDRLPRWAALLVPACLFAALHRNLASFAPLAALGLLFSLAYERTGDIRIPMVAHGLFNLCTALLIFAGADV